MRSQSEARILEAAIELFAESGYSASARDIAEHAGSTTMTMYRTFRRSKDYLFEEALREVINRSFAPGKFVLFIYEDKKSKDFQAILGAALQRWYFTMPPSSARLVGYAYLSPKEKWRQMADAAIEGIIGILATTIERLLGQKAEFEARIASKTVITTLFEMKMTRGRKKSQKPGKEEEKEVVAVVNYCLRSLS